MSPEEAKKNFENLVNIFNEFLKITNPEIKAADTSLKIIQNNPTASVNFAHFRLFNPERNNYMLGKLLIKLLREAKLIDANPMVKGEDSFYVIKTEDLAKLSQDDFNNLTKKLEKQLTTLQQERKNLLKIVGEIEGLKENGAIKVFVECHNLKPVICIAIQRNIASHIEKLAKKHNIKVRTYSSVHYENQTLFDILDYGDLKKLQGLLDEISKLQQGVEDKAILKPKSNQDQIGEQVAQMLKIEINKTNVLIKTIEEIKSDTSGSKNPIPLQRLLLDNAASPQENLKKLSAYIDDCRKEKSDLGTNFVKLLESQKETIEGFLAVQKSISVMISQSAQMESKLEKEVSSSPKNKFF